MTVPRHIFFFPIFMAAVVQQYVLFIALLVSPEAERATGLHILYLIFTPQFLPLSLLVAPTVAWMGFLAKRKAITLLCLIPQQLLLYISAGGAFHAIVMGQYADGIPRPHTLILADQALVIILALFHTWAIILTLRYGEDPNGV